MSDHGIVPVAPRRRAARVSRWLISLVVVALVGGSVSACAVSDGEPAKPFHILTGSENRILFDDPNSDEPTIMERFAKENNVELIPSYQGSVDTMIDLQNGAGEYDAVWPASQIWLDLGDTQRVVSRTKSIMTTPVVFGIKRSKAEELGWIGKDVSVDEILAAAEDGQLDFLMSSATQSNSGAMAYLGYLYAFAGHPEVLTSEMLRDPEVVDKLTRILGSVDRTAGASGFLRDLFLENYAGYDGMVNNESAIINANQQLMARGESDLLYVVYPVDGLAIADWPLGFVDHGEQDRSEIFDELQTYLLSDEVQQELLAQGRRTTKISPNMNPADVDPAVFNPDWGIDVTRLLVPITLPESEVILEALDLYQETFRKPSNIVFCLDYSGSMRANGKEELEAAMATLLDPTLAKEVFLQRTPRDITVVLPFAEDVLDEFGVTGNYSDDLQEMLGHIRETKAGGGTGIYGCLANALSWFGNEEEGYASAIILMTDGKSNEGSLDDFASKLPDDPTAIIPVYSILFGDASTDQLEEIADLTNGNIYDGRDGLVKAMRDAFANA